MIGKLLREPLLHFFVLGAVLFAMCSWLHRGQIEAPGEIFVSRAQVSSLQAQFERVWRRPANPAELQHLVDNWVREEIFYREGLAMGLDRDDPVVRRRVGQKIQFIIEGAAPTSPTTAELQAWLDAHRADYRTEPRYSLRQVYFDPRRHGANLERDIASARRALEGGSNNVGDATLLPLEMQDASQSEVEREFGAEFVAGLKSLAPGTWQGPSRSTFGVHLVRVDARNDGQALSLEQVRAEVERDLLQARAEESSRKIYDRLRANYRVRVESAAVPGPAG